MPFRPEKIQVGPANLWVGVTNPSSLSFISHTAGVPGDGTLIGLTDDSTTYSYTPKRTKIMAEQFYGPVGVFLEEEDVMLEFMAKESQLAALQPFFDSQMSSAAGYDGVFIGTGSGALPVRTQSVFFSQRHLDDATKYTIGLIYKAYCDSPFPYTMGRTKQSAWKVTLRAIVDVSRTSPDTMSQFKVEK